VLAALRLSGLPCSGIRVVGFDDLPQMNQRRLVVDNPTSVHVDLDAVAHREIIYISFGFVIFGWLFLRFHSFRASSS
jgi:hypothetical protein